MFGAGGMEVEARAGSAAGAAGEARKRSAGAAGVLCCRKSSTSLQNPPVSFLADFFPNLPRACAPLICAHSAAGHTLRP